MSFSYTLVILHFYLATSTESGHLLNCSTFDAPTEIGNLTLQVEDEQYFVVIQVDSNLEETNPVAASNAHVILQQDANSCC